MVDRVELGVRALILVPVVGLAWATFDLVGRVQAVLAMPEGPEATAAANAALAAGVTWMWILSALMGLVVVIPLLVMFGAWVYDRVWEARIRASLRRADAEAAVPAGVVAPTASGR